MNLFLNIIAWTFGIGASLTWIVRLYYALNYSKIDEFRDKQNGIRRTFPMMTLFIVALVCWAWIITSPLG